MYSASVLEQLDCALSKFQLGNREVSAFLYTLHLNIGLVLLIVDHVQLGSQDRQAVCRSNIGADIRHQAKGWDFFIQSLVDEGREQPATYVLSGKVLDDGRTGNASVQHSQLNWGSIFQLRIGLLNVRNLTLIGFEHHLVKRLGICSIEIIIHNLVGQDDSLSICHVLLPLFLIT